MEQYVQYIKKYFQEIIDKYKFDFVSIDDDEAVLIGKKFAITVGTSIDGVEITYICANQEGGYEEYWFDTFIAQVFDDSDAIGISNPRSIHEKILFELEVTARGLENHWANILEGDKSWIKDYLLNDEENEMKPANLRIMKIIKPYLEKQKI